MTERERLLNLLKQNNACAYIDCEACMMTKKNLQCIPKDITEYLLDNGVIVLPCKVGDNIYKIQTVAGKRRIVQYIITSIIQISEYNWILKYAKYGEGKRRYQCNINDIGNTVFVTYAEAEKALKEREK